MRKALTSAPSITVVGLLSAYLLIGFLLLPALLAWQLEKQIADRGHQLRVGAVRFDPLRLELEVDNLALADAQGAAMAGFDALRIDLQWRSIIDRAWTVAGVRLDAPTVHIDIAPDGTHNFTALMAQFAGSEPEPAQDDGTLPPVRLHGLQLVNGQVTWSDRQLAEPLVSRIAPLQIDVQRLSTLDDEPGRFRASARTAAGETLALHGSMALALRQVSGELALEQLQVATLARGLNRVLALQSPRGVLTLGGRFDLSIGANGAPAGGVRDLRLALTDLFLQPPGDGAAPLLALQSLAVNGASVDLARRAVHADSVSVADASAEAGIDARGAGSWEALLRPARGAPAGGGRTTAPAKSAPQQASEPMAGAASAASASAAPESVAATAPAASAPAAVAAATSGAASGSPRAAASAPAAASPPPSTATASGPPAGGAADTPWTLTVGEVRIDRLALAWRDATAPGSVRIGTLDLGTALDAQLGGAAGNRVRLPQLRLSANGLELAQGGAGLTLPATRVQAGAILLQNQGDGVDVVVEAVALALEQGLSARNGAQSATLGASDLALAGLRAQGGADALRLEIDAPKLQARAMAAEQAGQSARIGQLVAGGTQMVFATGAGSGVVLTLDAPAVQVEALAAASAPAGAAPIAGSTAELGQLALQAQRLAFNQRDGENTVSLDALQTQLQRLRIQADGQAVSMDSVALDNARLQLRQGAAGAQLQADTPALRLAGVAASRGNESGALADLSLQGAGIAVRNAADGATELVLSGMQATGKQLALARVADTLRLASMALGSERVTLALGTDAVRFSGSGVTAALGGAVATQAGNRLVMEDARWTTRAFDGRTGLGGDAARASASLEGSELRLTAIGLGQGAGSAANATAPGAGSGAGAGDLARLASASWSAGSLALDMADGPLQLRGNAMAVRLGQALLRDPSGQATELVRLGDIDLSGAAFSLADRSVTADTLRVGGLRGAAWLDTRGRLNLLEALGVSADPVVAAAPAAAAGQGAPVAPAAGPAPAADGAGVAASDGRPWRVAVRSVDLQDAALRFEDRRYDPPLALGLDAVTLNLTGVDTAAGAAPMQVALGAMLASGGAIKAQGSAALEPLAVDLQVALTGLALAPVQPVLSEYVALTLASGSASTQGRLTYGAVAGVPARLSYAGGFAVDRFLLEELAPKRPFLAWESVRSDDLKLTLGPDAVDIGEVTLEKPVGRLIIAEDQSINITDVLKKKPAAEGAVAGEKAPDTVAADGPAAATFPVTVARVKVSDGQLEFADLSLRPQFGTRMHQLKGVITGLGTDANRSAQVQLDARVDKFGSARIRGQASVLQPERLTDIAMAFRNLEMRALSPYVVKFAGYEIASGRLTLDLQYKVQDGRLQGENKLVLTKAELGKKVESPGALDLPLDLALAILKDANGVIDIGVPVRGDLNDPQFDYGAVIGKAIGNLIGGIVTAPFRALAAMFGGGDKPIDTIAFEPGQATLAPPEQQKIETVAKALKERPNLLLKVAPVVAPAQDRPVLQSFVVRSEIARRMGLELAPDEDPGPIDAANPRVPAAVEAAFGARYAPAVFDALKQRALEAAAPVATADGQVAPAAATTPPAPAGAASAPAAPPGGAASGAVASDAAAAVAPPAFYQGLIARMVSEQEVGDDMLARLAARRAEAIVQAVTGEDGGVPPARVQTGALRTVTGTDAGDGVVPLKLELDVAK